jgi:hypothetical protein
VQCLGRWRKLAEPFPLRRRAVSSLSQQSSLIGNRLEQGCDCIAIRQSFHGGRSNVTPFAMACTREMRSPAHSFLASSPLLALKLLCLRDFVAGVFVRREIFQCHNTHDAHIFVTTGRYSR